MQKINFSKWLNGTNNEPHVIFRGDNIEILKKLHSKFDNSVSCIYIDPPYNNGEKYAFYDDDNKPCQSFRMNFSTPTNEQIIKGVAILGALMHD